MPSSEGSTPGTTAWLKICMRPAPVVVSALREWRLAYPYGKDGIVFCTRVHGNRGGVLNHGEPWRVFQAAQLAAGVTADGRPKYHFHALRHFFASVGIEAGFSPKRLQVILGHASITMTYDVYGHLFPNPEDDYARLGAIEGLGVMADEAAEKVLVEVGTAKDDDKDVRKAAWRALRRSKRARKKKAAAPATS